MKPQTGSSDGGEFTESTLQGHTEAIQDAFGDLTSRFVHWVVDGIRGRLAGGLQSTLLPRWTCLDGACASPPSAKAPTFDGMDDGNGSRRSQDWTFALWDIRGKKLGVPVW